MDKFISGITEKYPKELLEGRLTVEGNVIGCLYKDPLLVDDCDFSNNDFITNDGYFYYNLAKYLRKMGYSVFDEVTILSSVPSNTANAFQERGGYEAIKHLTDIINLQNADTYLDNLYRENIILGLHRDGFNLLKPVMWNDKEVVPLKLFRQMDSESVTDWYESRLSSYGTGYTSKVLEEGYIEFDDEYFEKMDSGNEMGVPFDKAGDDVNLESMNCLPYLSGQIGGFYDGTFNILAGHSSVGKSSMWITIAMALAHYGRKILIISNEQKKKVFQDGFLVFIIYKYFRYYNLTKKKMRDASLSDDDKKIRAKAQKYWNDNYKNKIKFIAIADADMKLVKKKIRENVLSYGFDTVIYDTMKLSFEDDNKNESSWISLIKDSREFNKIAKKYNIIMLASLQLAMNSKGKLWLDGSELSTSKQIVEILETLLEMRSVYPEELDRENKKYFCHPFRLIKTDTGWIEEEYEPDLTKTYKALFVTKARNGQNSNDNNIGYLLLFDGAHGIFREVAQARFKHGWIGN